MSDGTYPDRRSSAKGVVAPVIFIFFLICICCLTIAGGCSSGVGTREPGRSRETTPFGRNAAAIPGFVEAEHYDDGEEGVAYHDDTPENEGGTNAFRATSVDLEAREDASGGYNLGWVREGEWLLYTVRVESSGTYSLEVRVASKKEGGVFHIEIDGEDKTGPMSVPDTGGWDQWRIIARTGIELRQGQHVLRVLMDRNGESGSIGDIDYFRFSKGHVATRGKVTVEPPEQRRNRVEIRVIDTETGRTTPSMLCIRSMDDGSVRLPPDGRVQTEVSRLPDFEKGIPFDRDDPNWIGPVRMMVGQGDNIDRSDVYAPELPSLPYWTEPVMYQTTGHFSIDLPDGQWRIAASHGMEYVPVVEEFEIRGGGSFTKRLELNRWINMAERGWYSGDVHVHHPTVTESDREYLLEYAVAEDLHVCNMLEWTHHYLEENGKLTSQYKVEGFGEKFRRNRGEYWLVSGQEDTTELFGCIEALNVGQLVPYTAETDGFCDRFFAAWHANEEAVVGLPHFGSWMHLSPTNAWTLTTGHIQFVELLQFMQFYTREYYEYLNLGFKLSAAAGSDVFWGSTLGEVRTYVYTGTPLDVDLWFENLKKGHTFVSNGPVLEFTVDGKLPGTELEKAARSTVKVIAKVTGHPRVALPRLLTLEGNDGVIRRLTNESNRSEMTLELELPIERSQWLAAHTVCTNGSVAHTTPVYVIVDGRPFWSLERGPEIIEGKLELIRGVERKFADSTDARGAGIVERMRKAIRFYDELRERMERTRGSP